MTWVAVGATGGAGAVARFLVDKRVSALAGRAFPYGTLAVNLSGTMLLGFLAGLALRPEAALIAGTGFVGAYTTFSTWMFESQRLSEEHQSRAAWANLAVSALAGLVAVWVGRALGGAL